MIAVLLGLIFTRSGDTVGRFWDTSSALYARRGRFFRVVATSRLDFGPSRNSFGGPHALFFTVFSFPCAFLHLVQELLQKSLLACTFCFSFPQCSAAVRAQHMELAENRIFKVAQRSFYTFLS